MAVTTSYDVQQITQGLDLIKQHKEAIRNAFGASGTGFEAKSSFSDDDVRRLQNSLGVTQGQAQLITSLWPVYQMGYQDGKAKVRAEALTQD